MADVTITAANVRPLVNSKTDRAQVGEDMAVGTLVYLHTDGKLYKADADAAASAQAVGMVVSVNEGARTTAYADEWVDFVWLGDCEGFSGLTIGALLYASTTAGAIADAAPAGSSGDYKWIVGRAMSATVIKFNLYTDDFAAQ